MEDLDRRRGRPPAARNAPALLVYLQHLLATDPASALVATDRDRPVAFGMVMVRETDAYLSFLFVLPEWQARGVGRAIVDACLAGAGPVRRLSTCAEADQPVATGLYASLGMAPREPLYLLRGAVDERTLPVLPVGWRTLPVTAADVAGLDRTLMGYERPRDHALWAADRRGWQVVTAAGELVGYGYAQPSGRLGPVAAARPQDLPALLGVLVRGVPVLEGRQVVVGGAAVSAMGPLLAAGMRLDGSPAIYCATQPGPRFDRYLPMSFALL